MKKIQANICPAIKFNQNKVDKYIEYKTKIKFLSRNMNTNILNNSKNTEKEKVSKKN